MNVCKGGGEGAGGERQWVFVNCFAGWLNQLCTVHGCNKNDKKELLYKYINGTYNRNETVRTHCQKY